MKRLLCILSGMNAGGAETFLMKVYRNIDRTEYQMDFCINSVECCFYEKEILNMGGKIYRIPPKSKDLVAFRRELFAIVKDNGYQFVLRVSSNALGFMDLKLAKLAGASVCSARSSNASDGGGWKTEMLNRIGRILYAQYVDVRIAPSDLAAKYTFGERAYNCGEINIIHNGLDLDYFRYYPEKRLEVRKEFKVDSDTKLIGHVGRFEKQKNHEFLLEVFKKIHEQDINSKLLLVGQGALENSIKEKVSRMGLINSVIFAGVRTDIPELLSAIDVFVFPSLYEGMPNTVIEAQATGLPCVVADTITKEANVTGLVEYLPLGDSEMWAECAINAINNERADTKYCMISKGYDIDSVVARFVSCIYKAC